MDFFIKICWLIHQCQKCFKGDNFSIKIVSIRIVSISEKVLNASFQTNINDEYTGWHVIYQWYS